MIRQLLQESYMGTVSSKEQPLCCLVLKHRKSVYLAIGFFLLWFGVWTVKGIFCASCSGQSWQGHVVIRVVGIHALLLLLHSIYYIHTYIHYICTYITYIHTLHMYIHYMHYIHTYITCITYVTNGLRCYRHNSQNLRMK